MSALLIQNRVIEWFDNVYEIEYSEKELQDFINEYNDDLAKCGLEKLDITPQDVIDYFNDANFKGSAKQNLITKEFDHKDLWYKSFYEFIRSYMDEDIFDGYCDTKNNGIDDSTWYYSENKE